MRFFPERFEEIKSSKTAEEVLLNIKSNTKIGSLTMERTDKYFKGSIENNFFKIISSEKPLGIFCVFEGKLIQIENETIIKLDSKFHNTFKILFYVWSLLPVFGIIISFFKFGIKALVQVILVAVLFGVIYFLVNFLFKKSYENGIKDLKRIINQ